jgi:hypothetical protein
MKRCHVIAVGLAACILVVAMHSMLPESGVSNTLFDRIELGMTLQEVQDAVGTPTGEVPLSNLHTHAFAWMNPDGSGFTVMFDHGGGVCEKTWHDSTETIGERLRRWVRWPW